MSISVLYWKDGRKEDLSVSSDSTNPVAADIILLAVLLLKMILMLSGFRPPQVDRMSTLHFFLSHLSPELLGGY